VQRDALDLREIERFEVTPDEVERWGLTAGDLLIVEGNGSEKEIGRTAVWGGQVAPCVYQNHLIRVRCNQPAVTSYLQLFLNSPDGRAEMKRLAITTSGLYNLSVGKIRRFVIAMPPIAEQARIVARVSELRRLCGDLRQRLTVAKATQSQLAEALVEQAVAG
jgi:type I restriction enzyme S subunit